MPTVFNIYGNATTRSAACRYAARVESGMGASDREAQERRREIQTIVRFRRPCRWYARSFVRATNCRALSHVVILISCPNAPEGRRCQAREGSREIAGRRALQAHYRAAAESRALGTIS